MKTATGEICGILFDVNGFWEIYKDFWRKYFSQRESIFG